MEQELAKLLLHEYKIQDDSKEYGVSIKYKHLLKLYDDDKDELKKYLRYLEFDKEIIHLIHIIIKSREPEIKSDKILVGTVPSDKLLSGENYYIVRRYKKLNLKLDDRFIIKINDIEKLKNVAININDDNKLNIYLSPDNGFYKLPEDIKKFNYPVKDNSKRFKIINSLRDGKKSGNFLAEKYTNDNTKQLSNEITSINKLFKNKLSVSNKIIIKVETGGYKLNYDSYNINFVE